MIVACYEYGRQVYERRITAADAADIIENLYDMNRNSALIYINNFPFLREGRAYNRILSVDATRCFIESFYRDYGNEGLQNALAALEGHINFQINVLGNPAHSLRRLLGEFRRRV
jgi:hypothetical protein